MGQYYHPTNIDKKQFVYSHSIKEKYTSDDGRTFESRVGLKLMEHSYIDNPMMNLVERLLMPDGAWHKNSIVWAGDYADGEGIESDRNGGTLNWYLIVGENKENEVNHEGMTEKIPEEYRYIINHTKKQFVDKSKLVEGKWGIIHPLSLLTAEGNGRGGGDYRGSREDEVGLWARDSISVETKAPEGFTEIDGQFKEA